MVLFLTIAQLAIDGQEAYSWVKYIYIDDPISSLDDNNAIAVACHLGQILGQKTEINTIVSTHHGLFSMLCITYSIIMLSNFTCIRIKI